MPTSEHGPAMAGCDHAHRGAAGRKTGSRRSLPSLAFEFLVLLMDDWAEHLAGKGR